MVRFVFGDLEKEDDFLVLSYRSFKPDARLALLIRKVTSIGFVIRQRLKTSFTSSNFVKSVASIVSEIKQFDRLISESRIVNRRKRECRTCCRPLFLGTGHRCVESEVVSEDTFTLSHRSSHIPVSSHISRSNQCLV